MRFKTRFLKEGGIFGKSSFFALFFPKFSGISEIFRNFPDFRGNFFPKIPGFSRKFFPENFAEIGCIFASSRKKTGKKTHFFFRNFRGFSGTVPGHFREIFLRKNVKFDQFYTNFYCVYTAAQSGFYENNEFFRKVVRTFCNFENSRKKFSPKFRKFSPGFSEIPGFSGNSRIFQKFQNSQKFQNFRDFVEMLRNVILLIKQTLHVHTA